MDGNEHLILPRGKAVWSLLKSALIEVDDGFHEQAAQCQKLLEDAEIVLKKRRHSVMFNYADSFGSGQVWSQIWIRN